MVVWLQKHPPGVMHTEKHLHACVLLCLLVWSSASGETADPYASSFGTGWHYRSVAEQHLIALNAPTDPCHIKAYGWRPLSTTRRHDVQAPWYSFRDVWQKWGWKVVLHNPTDKPLTLSMELTLKSTEGFVLDRAVIGTGVSDIFGPLKAWLPAHSTETFQGTSEYNTATHKGEGQPSSLDWRVFCTVQ
jgi:hypothetical protein